MTERKSVPFRWFGAVAACLLLAASPSALGQGSAGYSEYFVPADEDNMATIFNVLDGGGGTTMRSVVVVTAWAPNTTIYVDHWENGYDFDPNNPGSPAACQVTTGVLTSAATCSVSLATAGALRVFESANIPTPRNSANAYYDGRDRIYIAGGAVTVTRACGLEGRWAGDQASAWEVYPVKPQLTTYELPFGENLYAADPTNFLGFQRVFAIVQATRDNTTFQVDLDGNGTWDVLNQNRDGDRTDPGDTNTVTLQAGQNFLLDRVSACPTGTCSQTTGSLNSRTVVQGSETLQVKFVTGRVNSGYTARGLSAFPRGYWTSDYYAPFDQSTTAGRQTDYYLYNPQSTNLTVSWQSRTGSGSFTLTPGQTRSYRQAVGAVPVGSGLYFSAPAEFWGVGFGDSGANAYEWGYSLLPSTLLYREHFMGWAPGFLGAGADATNYNDDGVFLTPAQDNTTIFVDYGGDGTTDATYTLNRLQTQYIYDPNDGNLTGARIWGTGLFTMAYGENPNLAETSTPSLDLGYVAIPGTDYIDIVLGVDKSANPTVVGTAAGSTTTFTLTAETRRYALTTVTIVDDLPAGWSFQNDSATITLPDLSTISGAAANPTIVGQTLTWPTSLFPGGMAPNQRIVVSFTAVAPASTPGTLSQNRVTATGTRTVGGITQTFSATNFAYVVSGAFQITKTSNAANPLFPGDTFTYTVTVTNPAGSPTQTGVTLYDPIPAGLTASGSATLSRSSVADAFATNAYNLNVGTRNWSSNWTETDSGGGGATGGYIQVTGGELRLNNDDGAALKAAQRGIDLTGSGATEALLTFDYRTSTNLEAADVMNVQYRLGGAAGTWTTFAGGSFSGGVSGTASFAIPLASPANLTEVRFAIQATNSYGGATEYFYVDNLSITYDQSVTAGTAPSFLSSSRLYALSAGQSLTATFNVTVDDPFPTGQTEVTNVAATTTRQLPIQITATRTDPVENPTAGSASAGGRLWFDVDGDGAQDVGESGFANVEVVLKDRFGTPVATAMTDGNGRYLFTGVEPGTGYYVEAASGLPPGLVQTFPTGQPANRTTPFDLVDGQTYTQGDIGYRTGATTAAFGDRVWVDADGDGVQDTGEIGLGGVAMSLYRDANGDGFLDPGVDTLVATTTTDPDGSYLFTGASATGVETYFVSAATPSGYLSTNGTVSRFQGVSAGSTYLTADFGFNATATTYSIRDRVWLDLANFGAFDTGENGIGGVTVDLLDGSGNVIATTTTASDGTFAFSGLTGGTLSNPADYTVRVTDNAGLLLDMIGTSTYATAHERLEQIVTSNVDRTLPAATPSYGYRPVRSIGDFVWNDLDGDNVQDAGEPGLAGVVVNLYNDGNGNGVVDGADAVIATVTTDANGQYLFSGLANGSYVVSVPTPPSGFTHTGTGGDADSDPGTAGIQNPATISGGGNALDVDFGFRADTQRSVSGSVWRDADADGVIDGGETGYQGVEVRLYTDVNGDGIVNGSDALVSTLTTDASGNYTFQGLPPARYTVVLTDFYGVLTNLVPTYENTEGVTSSVNYREAVDLTSTDATGIRFGYRPPAPTYASVASLSAYASRDGVVVEWRTSLEAGTAGFELLRLSGDGKEYAPVNKALLPGLLVHPQGGSYRVLDGSAPKSGTVTYKLVERDVRGEAREHGPYTVPVLQDAAPDPGPTGFTRAAAEVQQADLARLAVLKKEKAAAEAVKAARTGPALKITTRERGLYFVTVDEIAKLMNLDQVTASGLIVKGRFALTRGGAAVPYLASESGLTFLAPASDSVYSADVVTWLAPGDGTLLGTLPVTTGGAVPATFPETVHREVNQWALPAVFSDPEGDFWCWDYVFAGSPTLGTKSFTLRASGVSGTGLSSLKVRLHGGTDTAAALDHHVLVAWNGVAVAEARWDGTAPHEMTIPVPATSVVEGDNTLTLTGLLDAGVAYSVVYLDSFDLSYERRYQASGNELWFTAPAGATVGVSGFRSGNVLVLDVTPGAPDNGVVPAKVYSLRLGTYSARFAAAPGTTDRTYLAVATDRLRAPDRVVAWEPTGLSDTGNRADYLLVAPASLLAAAESLAAFRATQGWETKVVDVEDVYDEFGDGVPSPHAIRELLRYARQSWSLAPRDVTLVGRGTYDPQDFRGFGDDLVPTLMAATPYGLAVSDVRIGDLDGDDGLPEVAVGRLPVLTSQELDDYLAKAQLAAGMSSPARVLMTADNPDLAGSFPADSDAVAQLVPVGQQVDKVYLTTYTAAQGKQAILTSAALGVSVFNYIGHGGFDRLASESLFQSSDVPSLANATTPFLFVGTTCAVGNFGVPGFPSLSEKLVLKTTGGAHATWAASGLSENEPGVVLNKALFRNAFVRGVRLLGDLVLDSFGAPEAAAVPAFMRYQFNLLGEPVGTLPATP